MNYSIIRYILGWIFNFQAFAMIFPCIVSVIYGENEVWVFLICIGICLGLGLLLTYKKPKNKVFFAREGFVAVALSWILLSISGALPFIFSGSITNVVDAVFETVSGFTTTGSSILADVESLPYSIIFWRSFTHWLGGMGVLVFLLMILPMNGGYQMFLMKAESPGPSVSKLVPKVRTTAMILYGIYMLMSIVQVVLLLIGHMPLFDALCTTFGSAGTGGFGIKNDSMASYSAYNQVVTGIFMMLFGINFNVYFMLLMKKPKQALKCEEARWYIGIIAASTAVITVFIANMYGSVGEALRHAFFQVSSIITTTGFATTNFDLWPAVPKGILVLLMLIGACAGSTGGGIKVSRLIILVKSIGKELKQIIHPKNITKIRLDGKVVEHDTVRSVNVFLVTYLLIFAVSVLLISIDNKDLVTNFTAVAATFNNIGPGLAQVGPIENFGCFSNFSTVILTIDMLAGRLEIFPLLILFMRDTWKRF
ncbi:MAG TPA: TrkH family potassium uptake protein [Candidatus Scybalocola faecavium]|nr:TrkH family potassium uptake protein [Candidatus Scybalocola faecavium]